MGDQRLIRVKGDSHSDEAGDTREDVSPDYLRYRSGEEEMRVF
jgi:hypothetical protein